MLVGEAPEREARARGDGEAGADDAAIELGLFLELLSAVARDFPEWNVDLGELDRKSELREALEVSLHLVRARPLSRVHVHLKADAVDRRAALLQALHE